MFKKIIFKLMKFLIILLIVDSIVGSFAKRIYFNQKTGKQARITKSLQVVDDEILFFGSSRAARHYNPKIFENELGVSCYNTGVKGQGILFQSILLEIILKRTNPQLIILNIDESTLYKSNRAYDRIRDINPYYSDYPEIIKPYLSMKSSLVDLKLFLKSFQYNSTIVHAIKYYFFPQEDIKGFLPLYGEIKANQNKIDVKSNQGKILDENFINALYSFVYASQKYNFKLIFIKSPNLRYYDFSKSESINKIKEISEKNQIPFVDFSNNEIFLEKYSLFYDNSHLNIKGSDLLSNLLAEKIKSLNIPALRGKEIRRD